MKSNSWADWFTAATNVAVLAGVLLVAFEIRQNTGLARIAAEQSQRETSQNLEAQVLGDNFAVVWEKSVFDPASLTIAEIRQLDAYMAAKLEDIIRTANLEEDGLVEIGSTLRHIERDASFLFGSRFSKIWWQNEGSTWNADVTSIAEPIIATIDDDFLKEKFLAIQEDARLPASQ